MPDVPLLPELNGEVTVREGYKVPCPECNKPILSTYMSTHRREVHRHGGRATGRVKKPSHEMIECPECGHPYSESFLNAHLRKTHGIYQRRNKDGSIQRNVQYSVKGRRIKAPDSILRPKGRVKALDPADVCTVVLEIVLPSGKLPVAAVDAYVTWVQATKTFLEAL